MVLTSCRTTVSDHFKSIKLKSSQNQVKLSQVRLLIVTWAPQTDLVSIKSLQGKKGQKKSLRKSNSDFPDAWVTLQVTLGCTTPAPANTAPALDTAHTVTG